MKRGVRIAVERFRSCCTYLYADNCRSPIVDVVRRGASIVARGEFSGIGSLTTFGEGLTGELYVASRDGTIYKIVQG